jgi:PAS domain-containing protein
VAATAINATVVALVLWHRVAAWHAAVWLVCQLASATLRYELYLQFRGGRLVDAREVATRLRGVRLGALVSGVLWGSSAIFLYPYASMPHQIFLAFVLGGMVAGATGLYSLDLKSFAIYTVASLTPVTMQLFSGGTLLHLAMGGMVILFAVLMGWIALQNHRSIMTSLRLSVENVGLVASLTAEKDRAERLNLDLTEEIRERERAEQELRRHRDHLEELVEERARGLAAANEQLLEVIADREQAEQQASRVAREWTSTFDNMLDMVAIIGPDRKIARANAPLARFLSVRPGELVGRPCHEVLYGCNQPCSGCPHQQALRAISPIAREVIDARGGVPLMVSCSPFFNEAGESAGSVHVPRDISEQKRAEVKREELISQLQHAVAKVKLLSGLLPICSACKKIRDDQGYWTQLETYIRDHSEAQFTHGICPQCSEALYPEYHRKGQ